MTTYRELAAANAAFRPDLARSHGALGSIQMAVEMLPEAHESFRAVIGALCLALQANREAFLPLFDASWGGYPRPVSKRKAANPMPSC